MMVPAPMPPDRVAQKAALKRTSALVTRYSEELAREGLPPESQRPEALEELGRKAAAALTDSRMFKIPQRAREAARTATSRIAPVHEVSEVNGAVRVLFGGGYEDWPFACVTGTDGFICAMNKQFLDALGYGLKDLQDTSFLDLVHSDDRERTVRAIDKLAHGEPVREFVNHYCTRNGDYIPIAWCALARGTHIYALARPA